LNYPNPNDYNSNGNQTGRHIVTPDGMTDYTLGYDAENRLVSVSGPFVTTQFTFDGDDRRVKSVVNEDPLCWQSLRSRGTG